MKNKEVIKKYQLFVNQIIKNYDDYEKDITEETKEKLKLIDKLITDVIEETIIKPLLKHIESAKQ